MDHQSLNQLDQVWKLHHLLLGMLGRGQRYQTQERSI